MWIQESRRRERERGDEDRGTIEQPEQNLRKRARAQRWREPLLCVCVGRKGSVLRSVLESYCLLWNLSPVLVLVCLLFFISEYHIWFLWYFFSFLLKRDETVSETTKWSTSNGSEQKEEIWAIQQVERTRSSCFLDEKDELYDLDIPNTTLSTFWNTCTFLAPFFSGEMFRFVNNFTWDEYTLRS